jgi:FlaA1/EpsC-like NDP-sugar epimerase
MDKKQTLKLWLEVIWLVLTALVLMAVLYPIHKAMHVWPFQGWNIAFVIILLTLARYIFLMKHTFLATQQEVKVALLLLMFPLTFVMMNGVNFFMVFIEENTWDPMTGHLPAADKRAIEEYIWAEMLFFGVGSSIAAPAFAVRLMLSIWRTRNRGTA